VVLLARMHDWLEALLARQGDLQAISASTGSEHKSARDIKWTYGTLLSSVQAVASAMCAASHAPSSPTEVGAGRVNGARPSLGERHVVMWGSAFLQSVVAIACSKHGYVGVFVPAEDTDEHTLSIVLIVQRACEASIILIALEVWNDLSAPLKDRYATLHPDTFFELMHCQCGTVHHRLCGITLYYVVHFGTDEGRGAVLTTPVGGKFKSSR
jgi:hypothetical protein